MNDPSDQENEERLRRGLHRLADSHVPTMGAQPAPSAPRPRRGLLIVAGACLVLLGVGLFVVNRGGRTDDPVAVTGASVTTSPASIPLTTVSAPTSTSETSDGACGDLPTPTLVGADRASVEMALIWFTDTCGFDADGDAMFDDAFRPTEVLPVDGVVRLTGADDATVHIDVRPLESDLVLRRIEPVTDELLLPDSRRAFRLGQISCAVVTVDWRTDTSRGVFTAMAESETGACRHLDE